MAKYGPTPRPLAERFWEKVDRREPDACWSWLAATSHGYGKFGLSMRDGVAQAHRIAWVLTYGLVPDSLYVLHRCDNPPCCNPAHLFLGTHADNMADMIAKGRHRPGRPTGERSSGAKLTWLLVAELRERYRITGCTQQSLADHYGVSVMQVQRILYGRAWKAEDRP